MSLTYAIPDLHGRFDLLREALAKIAECHDRAPTRRDEDTAVTSANGGA